MEFQMNGSRKLKTHYQELRTITYVEHKSKSRLVAFWSCTLDIHFNDISHKYYQAMSAISQFRNFESTLHTVYMLKIIDENWLKSNLPPDSQYALCLQKK